MKNVVTVISDKSQTGIPIPNVDKGPTPNKISTPKRILRAIKNSKLNQNDGVS